MICASAPAIKGITVAAVRKVAEKLGKVKKEPFQDQDGCVDVDYVKGEGEGDLEKSVISVSVSTVHRNEY